VIETTSLSLQSFQEACDRVRLFDSAEAAQLQPTGHTRLFTYPHRTERVAVLFHGITNNPLQWEHFGLSLYAEGWNVLIPRLPYHGLQDLLTTLPAKLGVADMVAYTKNAVEIGQGLGDNVAVVGLSAGGVYTAWAAQEYAIERAIVIAPLFGLHDLPLWVTPLATGVVRYLPNQMRWWDPKKKANHIPPHAYPQYSTHNMAETLTMGFRVQKRARVTPPQCRDIMIITNAADRAVSNAATEAVADLWKRQGTKIGSYQFAATEGLPHDVIDITQPRGKPDLVYALLREVLAAKQESHPS
jgi:carboxylesterase